MTAERQTGEPTRARTGDQPTPQGTGSGGRTMRSVEVSIRAAYSALVARRGRGAGGSWVKLSDLRPLLKDIPPGLLDAVLDRMIERPDVQLMAELNQKTLTDRDRKAAVEIGGEDRHLLNIGPR